MTGRTRPGPGNATTDPDARPVWAPRRMSDAEALMWNLEKDPRLSGSMAVISVLDRAPQRSVLRTRLAGAVAVIPRLHQRVVPSFGRLAPPEWRDDPDFDLDRHVRWVSLAAPGSDEQLDELALRVLAAPLDRTRPLWEFMVVEGLTGGRAALVQKVHHTITDGEGGVVMASQFVDLERDADRPMLELSPPPPEAEPTTLLATITDTLTHDTRRLLGVVARATGGTANLARHPAEVPSAARDTATAVRSLARQFGVRGPGRSPLWRRRTLRRRFVRLRVPFAPVKSAAKALGGSINDVFVTAVVAGAADYHRRLGSPIEELRVAMAVSTRRDGSAGGNAFSPTRVVVPATMGDIADHVAAVRARLAVAKTERAIDLVGPLAGIANLLPTSVITRLARQQAATVDVATSNVRMSPFPVYIAGSKIEANFPVGPLVGTALNVTMLSYAGSLDIGLHADAAAVTDPELLRDCISEAFDGLSTYGLAPAARRRTTRSRR